MMQHPAHPPLPSAGCYPQMQPVPPPLMHHHHPAMMSGHLLQHQQHQQHPQQQHHQMQPLAFPPGYSGPPVPVNSPVTMQMPHHHHQQQQRAMEWMHAQHYLPPPPQPQPLQPPHANHGFSRTASTMSYTTLVPGDDNMSVMSAASSVATGGNTCHYAELMPACSSAAGSSCASGNTPSRVPPPPTGPSPPACENVDPAMVERVITCIRDCINGYKNPSYRREASKTVRMALLKFGSVLPDHIVKGALHETVIYLRREVQNTRTTTCRLYGVLYAAASNARTLPMLFDVLLRNPSKDPAFVDYFMSYTLMSIVTHERIPEAIKMLSAMIASRLLDAQELLQRLCAGKQLLPALFQALCECNWMRDRMLCDIIHRMLRHDPTVRGTLTEEHIFPFLDRVLPSVISTRDAGLIDACINILNFLLKPKDGAVDFTEMFLHHQGPARLAAKLPELPPGKICTHAVLLIADHAHLESISTQDAMLIVARTCTVVSADAAITNFRLHCYAITIFAGLSWRRETVQKSLLDNNMLFYCATLLSRFSQDEHLNARQGAKLSFEQHRARDMMDSALIVAVYLMRYPTRTDQAIEAMYNVDFLMALHRLLRIAPPKIRIRVLDLLPLLLSVLPGRERFVASLDAAFGRAAEEDVTTWLVAATGACADEIAANAKSPANSEQAERHRFLLAAFKLMLQLFHTDTFRHRLCALARNRTDHFPLSILFSPHFEHGEHRELRLFILQACRCLAEDPDLQQLWSTDRANFAPLSVSADFQMSKLANDVMGMLAQPDSCMDDSYLAMAQAIAPSDLKLELSQL